MAIQRVYLECTSGGHNKFYEMTGNGDGTFSARYGTIGAPGTVTTYPMSKWNAKLREKLRKGYVEKVRSTVPDSAASGIYSAQTSVQRTIDKVNRTGKKYGFTGASRVVNIPRPVTVYQIFAKADFVAGDGTEIKAGAFGGWIERPDNLAQDSSCWIMGDAVVCDQAYVKECAVVRNSALVYGFAAVYGIATVKDSAVICEYAKIAESSVVYGNAHIEGYAQVSGRAWVNADVRDHVHITDEAWVEGGSYSGEETIMTDRIIE